MPGEDGAGVYGVVELIEKIKSDPQLTLDGAKRALVICGGNTALTPALVNAAITKWHGTFSVDVKWDGPNPIYAAVPEIVSTVVLRESVHGTFTLVRTSSSADLTWSTEGGSIGGSLNADKLIETSMGDKKSKMTEKVHATGGLGAMLNGSPEHQGRTVRGSPEARPKGNADRGRALRRVREPAQIQLRRADRGERRLRGGEPNHLAHPGGSGRADQEDPRVHLDSRSGPRDRHSAHRNGLSTKFKQNESPSQTSSGVQDCSMRYLDAYDYGHPTQVVRQVRFCRKGETWQKYDDAATRAVPTETGQSDDCWGQIDVKSDP